MHLLKTGFKNEPEEETLENIDRIYQSSQKLNELVENLLSWARVQTNRLTVRKENIPVQDVIRQILSYYEETLENKSLDIDISLSADTMVSADPNMMKIVFQNLLSNAIKFSYHNSTISIGCKKRKRTARVIFIKDQGMGIPEETLDKVLDDTAFISTKGTNNEEGTGLGLKISKEFVEKNDGELWLESIPGDGTTAHVMIPNS